MTHTARTPLLNRFVGGVRQFVTDTRVHKVPRLTPGGAAVALFTSRIAPSSPILDRHSVEEGLKSCIKELLAERENLKEQLQEARDAPPVPQHVTGPDSSADPRQGLLNEHPASIAVLETKLAELSASVQKLQQVVESKSNIAREQLRARKTAESARDSARDAAKEHGQTIEQLRAQLKAERDARLHAEEDLQSLRADLNDTVAKWEAAETARIDIQEELMALRSPVGHVESGEESVVDEYEQELQYEATAHEAESEYGTEDGAEDEDGYESGNEENESEDEEYASEEDFKANNDDSGDEDLSMANTDCVAARLSTLVSSPGPAYGFADNITFVHMPHMDPLPPSLPPSPHSGFDTDFAHDFAENFSDDSMGEFDDFAPDDFSDGEMSPDSGYYSEGEF